MIGGFIVGCGVGFFIAIFLIALLPHPSEAGEKPKGHRCVRCKYPVAKQPGSLCQPCAKAVEASCPKAPPAPPAPKWRPPPPPRRLPDQHIYIHNGRP